LIHAVSKNSREDGLPPEALKNICNRLGLDKQELSHELQSFILSFDTNYILTNLGSSVSILWKDQLYMYFVVIVYFLRPSDIELFNK
jgi:hypothetical protein